jgi:L-alanine-DL-glutamate epimerase-like enolase superfamily enzyme
MSARASRSSIERIRTTACRIPTDQPESDGTFDWNATTIVIVEIEASGKSGLGYSYTDRSAADLIHSLLEDVVVGGDPMQISAMWYAMRRAVRNVGATGVAASAISAVDVALWDLKARLLGLPLATLLGALREDVRVYGSGGFTSYADRQLAQQLESWVASGIHAVKMKIGREKDRDLSRVGIARRAIGPEAELFVDANGAYSRKEAVALAERLPEFGVTWFEEPVVADDVIGLRFIRETVPASVQIAAGEYGWDPVSLQRLVDEEAVDVLQADATRCAGISGFMQAAALCAIRTTPMSAHTAPAIHVHPCCAARTLRHIEYFHDHVRIESMLFDGVQQPRDGRLAPDLSRPGLGLELKRQDAQPYAI